MDAAVMHGPDDIRFESVPRPACPPGGFVVRVDAVGLCGSDIRNLTTDSRKGAYPHIYGHEVVGEVVEADPSVSACAVGQELCIYPVAHCLRCEQCRSGHHEQCTEVEEYTERPGGFAQYIAYTATRAQRGAFFPLPDGVDPVLATLAEPLSSTYACVENIDVRMGDTVAILGAGPVGVMLAVLSRMRGADKVISANPSPRSQQQAVGMARPTGTVVLFGGVPRGSLTELDTNVIHYRSLWVYGHYGANSTQVERAFELAISPRFPTRQFLTHVLPLSEINEAIRLPRTGEALKVALLPQQRPAA